MFNSFFRDALNQAHLAAAAHEVPVGCVAVFNGEVISQNHNRVEEYKDQTAHAEMLILRDISKILKSKKFFGLDISLYCTLEPCCMCLTAISMFGIKNVYYAAKDDKFGGEQRIYTDSSGLFKPNMFFMPQDEAIDLMKSFFKELRPTR